jgi:hypothetical protein
VGQIRAEHIGRWSLVAATALAAACGKFGGEADIDEEWAMLDRYCVECHNNAEYTADVSFEGRRPADVAAHTPFIRSSPRSRIRWTRPRATRTCPTRSCCTA